jgi:hypothetical protein
MHICLSLSLTLSETSAILDDGIEERVYDETPLHATPEPQKMDGGVR